MIGSIVVQPQLELGGEVMAAEDRAITIVAPLFPFPCRLQSLFLQRIDTQALGIDHNQRPVLTKCLVRKTNERKEKNGKFKKMKKQAKNDCLYIILKMKKIFKKMSRCLCASEFF